MEIVDITNQEKERKKHLKETSELEKKVFELPVSETARYIFVGKLPDNIASIHSDFARVDLLNQNYLEKAKEFARLYEERFGKDITLYTNYS
ncbi:MAG: hypothetical protein ABIG37_02705 [Nanoarchaeota archaeon]|nr:hypothetical protein [Nanoarchaeota archaeon]